LIIAPHEISPSHIKELSEQFSPAILFSNLVKGEATAARVLIIDNVGMLSRLYHYADIALIGGGFRKSGVHNVLEAAVYGKPVIFGPEYHKYSEAVSLVETGGGISVKDGEALRDTVRLLLSNPGEYRNCAGNALRYVAQNKGATQKILNFIQEKRLLTI
jgi:3-deoxy-D-manno-octulosonic-acid transferase